MWGILILAFLNTRLSWVKWDCTHASTRTCVQTGGWKSWSPWVMNQCSFPQGVRDGISKQVHQEQLQQACWEGCHQPTLQIVSQMMTFQRVSFQFVLKSLFSIEFHPTRAAERAHCQTPNAALTYPEQPSPICLYQLNLTATPLVIAMLCQNKSTGIRRESISTLIKDLPAGFSKCKVYLIIAFQWVFRKSSSSMYDSFSSAQTICSLCMASI